MRLFPLVSLTALLCIPGCGGSVSIPAPGKINASGAGMHRKFAEVPGVGKVNYAMSIDGDYDGTKPVPLILFLHYGYEGSRPDPHTGADMIDTFRSCVDELGGVAIAPDVVGGDWKSKKNEVAAVWLVKSVMNSYNIDEKRVIVAGYSMGGEGTWYIGGRHQDLFTAAIPIAAPVAGGTDWKIPIYAIHSDKDTIVPFAAAKAHADKIQAAGGKIRFATLNGISHYDMGSYASRVWDAAKWAKAQ